MKTRICPRYDGSVIDSVSDLGELRFVQRERDVQDVIEVENTVSPKTLRGAPKERPWNDWPVFRCRTAGIEGLPLA